MGWFQKRLASADVHVELVLGTRSEGTGLGAGGPDLHDPLVVALSPDPGSGPGARRFRGRHVLEAPGGYGYGVRVRPRSLEAGISPLHEPAVWA